jgi:hypothetical protein
MNKKGFELSANMLVIIILAIAILGFGIFFIQKLFNIDIEIPQKCDISPPTAASPVCIVNEMKVKRASEVSTKISVYNDESQEIAATIKPQIECSQNVDGQTLNLKLASAGIKIPVGEVGEYSVVIQIPKDAPKSTFPCTFSVSNTQKQFSIVVE